MRFARSFAPLALAALVSLVAPAAVHAAVAPVNKTFLGGLALDGYDPVAYFTDGKAVEGSKEFSTEWKGATWRFASAAHKDAFVKEPERYAPQYGGYCAWAVAHGSTADADPEMWTIVDGKLYVNYDKKIMEQWKADIPAYIKQADVNWPKLLSGD